jgi:hypothetical protein
VKEVWQEQRPEVYERAGPNTSPMVAAMQIASVHPTTQTAIARAVL